MKNKKSEISIDNEIIVLTRDSLDINEHTKEIIKGIDDRLYFYRNNKPVPKIKDFL